MRKLMGLLAVAGLVLGAQAWAEDAAGKDPGGKDEGKKAWGGGKMMERMKAKLELTDEQVAKLKAINEAQMKAQTPLWEDLGKQMKELKELVDAKAPDAKLTAKIKGLKATRDKIEANRKKFEGQKEAVLTPMQQAKTALWMGRAAKQMMQGGHEGRGWGQGGKHESGDAEDEGEDKDEGKEEGKN